MNNIETMKLALEALETMQNAIYNIGGEHVTDLGYAVEKADVAEQAITALRQAINAAEQREQAQKQEPVTIWYMRDNHTFKKLSEDVSTALIEIEQEFNEGHTYGMLCSKRKGFPSVHASGDKKRLEFFAECKATLEQWLPKTSPPPRQPEQDGVAMADYMALMEKYVALKVAQPKQKPVACGYDETTGNCTNNQCCYTSPPPRPVAEPHKPLTDEQILEIFGVHLHEDNDIEEFRHLITDARHNQLY